ncbi:hypothetical protein HNQ52_001632 [Chiayiivirga flava]|uniref:Uncharacterized protein n=1 Tax=Chiayiivirga flava TaxID=659595 RepID=A0A7W8G0T0_9GAMM|nr:hypothetical protein [Chiayiivirga flava]
MASDLFPIRRNTRPRVENTVSAPDLPRGNPLADAVVRAFRETFGLGGGGASDAPAAAPTTTTGGTIVPSAGEINP